MICKICNNEFADSLNSFGYHLSHTHNIKYKEYYDLFLKGDTDGLCKICNKPTNWYRHSYRIYCCKKCFQADHDIVEKRESTMLNRYNAKTTLQSNELRLKTQITCLEKYNDTNPYRFGSNLFKQAMLDKYGIDCYLKILSEDDRTNALSLSWSDEAIEKRKNTCMLNYGVPHQAQSKLFHQKSHKKYTFNNIMFDSSWELAYYIWLTDHNIVFEYQPNITFKYSYNNKEHYYNPDFRIANEIYEIKGLHFFENKDSNSKMINPYTKEQDGLLEAKHQCMIANNVHIITNCNKYINYIKNKYGKNFLKQCRS